MIYLVDIDGTIADLSHRLHFIESEPKDWDGFFAACVGDVPIPTVLLTVRALRNCGANLIFVTGRNETVRPETLNWLEDNGVYPDQLHMRKRGDRRADNIVKSELLDEILKTVKQGDIVAAFEDRNQVVQMYRERGITVFQVADGNF